MPSLDYHNILCMIQNQPLDIAGEGATERIVARHVNYVEICIHGAAPTAE